MCRCGCGCACGGGSVACAALVKVLVQVQVWGCMCTWDPKVAEAADGTGFAAGPVIAVVCVANAVCSAAEHSLKISEPGLHLDIWPGMLRVEGKRRNAAG